MKTKDLMILMGLFIVGTTVIMLVMYGIMGGSMSTIGDDTPTGAVVSEARWTNQLVPVNLLSVDKYTSGDVSASAKVYKEQPTDWGNPRGLFDKTAEYTLYTATNGTINVNREKPGTYYVVLTASGYNTQFLTIEIPDGSDTIDSLSDYSASPYTINAEMSLVGDTTGKDFTLTLTNQSSITIKETVLLSIDKDTEFRGWKVIVNDEIGFSTDEDGDGTYDEGIMRFKINVNGIEKQIFNPSNGVDEFDSNDEYTFMINDIVRQSQEDLTIKIEILAITGDYTDTSNDEVLGEGDGLVSYIKIYDQEGNLFATSDVTA